MTTLTRCRHIGAPEHALPALDHTVWRRFLEPADLYVLRENGDASRNPDIVEEVLAALDRIRAVMTEEANHSLGSTVMQMHEERALVHHHLETGAGTTLHLDVVIDGVNHQLEMTVPKQLGPWPLMAPGEFSTEREQTTAMRRIHRVMTAQIRHFSKQRRGRLREAQDKQRRTATVAAYAKPILHNLEPRRLVLDMPTPWGDALVPLIADHDSNQRVREALADTPVAQGTRLAIEISRFEAEGDRGPINRISLKPVREVVDASTCDPMEAMRAALRLASMPPLAPLFETSESRPFAPDPR